ncbi:hypothetical protein J6590_055994 [Homalodisca vitripennis]|nr:hypothetical protein J6590_055994 [Homalodisca vitripennis]
MRSEQDQRHSNNILRLPGRCKTTPRTSSDIQTENPLTRESCMQSDCGIISLSTVLDDLVSSHFNRYFEFLTNKIYLGLELSYLAIRTVEPERVESQIVHRSSKLFHFGILIGYGEIFVNTWNSNWEVECIEDSTVKLVGKFEKNLVGGDYGGWGVDGNEDSTVKLVRKFEKNLVGGNAKIQGKMVQMGKIDIGAQCETGGDGVVGLSGWRREVESKEAMSGVGTLNEQSEVQYTVSLYSLRVKCTMARWVVQQSRCDVYTQGDIAARPCLIILPLSYIPGRFISHVNGSTSSNLQNNVPQVSMC